MPPRRRVTVSDSDRNRWLEQLDRGTGITEISRAARRDIRVVKRHIEIAREERGTGRARHDFILGRLELHHEDLLAEVRRIQAVLRPFHVQSLEPTETLERKIHEAFNDHVGRMHVGRLLPEWERAVGDYHDIRDGLRELLSTKEKELVKQLPGGALHEWMPQVLSEQEAIFRGGRSSCFEYQTQESKDGSKIQIHRGSTSLTKEYVDKSFKDDIVEAHRTLRSVATLSAAELKTAYERLRKVAEDLVGELDVFLLKRLVPGRCRYCPA